MIPGTLCNCRYTVILTLLSTGKLLKTMVIFRNLKNVPKGPFPADVVVCASKTGVMTSDLMVNEYLPKVRMQIKDNFK